MINVTQEQFLRLIYQNAFEKGLQRATEYKELCNTQFGLDTIIDMCNEEQTTFMEMFNKNFVILDKKENAML
jgi:hypothetical protein